ncbi:esterase FE4-like [Ctenocephalides felis]|uniref:esterase FE4-like n=1 Tax=Ctenocephalides felis TaxID=7515 RepID=UPI00001515BC|nr:esterase FE4-like [Ctenocephalides felis]
MADLQVTLLQGTLKGKEQISEKGNVFHSYSGIPYAKPPVGDLRFKPPQPAEPWSGVLDASKEGNSCRSVHFIKKIKVGAEDCLYLNVYVPKTSEKSLLPVMVWIHGGGFFMGSGNSDMYGPEYLMDYGIVLVTFNYRLGVLGFLNLGIEEAPGNVGLMDQVEALKWVKNNIASFGGDPNNVTIFGESAGGASVHYLMLSDLSKGLFHKAISQSGSAFNPWALQHDNNKENAFRLCKLLGHPVDNETEALKILRQAPIDDLIDNRIKPKDKGQLIIDYPFLPTIEKRYQNFEPFLDQSPLSKMQSGNFTKVPFICGYNSAEGILGLMDFKDDPNIFEKFEADFERFVPVDLNLTLRSKESKKLAEEMRKFYYQDEPVSSDNKEKFVSVISDTWFLRGIKNTARYIIEHSSEPLYLYVYSFDDFGFLKKLVLDPNIEGAAHGDELGYLFKMSFTEFPKDLPSAVVNRERLLQLWTNFAKTGNPTPEINDVITTKWDKATEEKSDHMDIDNTLRMIPDPDAKRLRFWNKFL